MLEKIKLVLRTVRYLQPIQIAYQLYYRLVPARPFRHYLPPDGEPRFVPLTFTPAPPLPSSFDGKDTFTFLNISHRFPGTIQWDLMSYGKLWNYNLHYMDFLGDTAISIDTKGKVLRSFYRWLTESGKATEPYPASLRAVNVIKFLCADTRRIPEFRDIVRFVYADLSFLHSRYEYHLLANHLLENAFALYIGGHFFDRNDWTERASRVLFEQLNEQILTDGAHFELSPMYHSIILFRVCEAIGFSPRSAILEEMLREKGQKMVHWLSQMTFADGSVPHLNDSTDGISRTTRQLTEFAKNVGVPTGSNGALSDSGYRKYVGRRYEMVTDVSGISPSYQPGHAHADHGSFVLHADGRPLVVDPGISTYEIGERRSWERSTMAHNTVTVGEIGTSETWSSFRVGRRAQVSIINESSRELSLAIASRVLGGTTEVLHKRRWVTTEDRVEIIDELSVNGGIFRLYFHPDAPVETTHHGMIVVPTGVSIRLDGAGAVRLMPYEFNLGYNRRTPARMAEIRFDRHLVTEITFERT